MGHLGGIPLVLGLGTPIQALLTTPFPKFCELLLLREIVSCRILIEELLENQILLLIVRGPLRFLPLGSTRTATFLRKLSLNSPEPTTRPQLSNPHEQEEKRIRS